MKTRLLIIIVIAAFAFPLVWFDQAYAMCVVENEINWNSVASESELVFTGTVTRLDNYDGPQRVTFFVHDVIKGEIDAPKYVLENTGMVFLENNTIRSSSVSVDYKIGKTYKVYVANGETNRCTTKVTNPPADYMWEPGPEDGNYYSENPAHVNPCEEGYGLSDGICTPLEEMNKDLPICDPNPKHDFGKCKKGNEPPDGTLQDVLDNCSCQESGQDCIEPLLRWWNATYFIDNIDCEFLDKVEGSSTYAQTIYPKPEVTGSYDIADENGEKICLGGRDMILDDQCRLIGNYDVQTGIPIVNNKEECDNLDGTWYDDRKLCDSKYAPVEYRFQFGPEPEPFTDPDNLCPPGKVFDWDICVDECPFGQIEKNGICHSVENVSDYDDRLPWYFLIIAYWPVVIITLGIIVAVVFVWRKRK